MAQVHVRYNPYRMETKIDVNGKMIPNDSTLYKVVKGKRLQEWVGKFPQMLVDELNTVDFDIEFYGMNLDWDDFEDAFSHAKEKNIVKKLNMRFVEGRSDKDIEEMKATVFQAAEGLERHKAGRIRLARHLILSIQRRSQTLLEPPRVLLLMRRI